MANIPLSTIGVKIAYCISSASTAPSTGYTLLKGLYSTPDLSLAPNTEDATSFDNTKTTTKIKLLSEIPDNLEFGMRLGQEAFETWEAMVSAFEASASSNYQAYYCIKMPGLTKAVSFTGEPSHIGLPALEANSGADATVYITPTGEPTWITTPTF